MNFSRYLEHPLWLLLATVSVVLIAALAWRASKIRRDRCVQLGVAPTSWSWGRGISLVLAMTLFGIAAAGPRWGETTSVATAGGCDVAIVLDVSRSMSAKDEMPDRIAKAQELAAKVVALLARQGGHRVAVIAFASKPTLVAPLTYDLGFIRTALADLDAPSLRFAPNNPPSGTRIGVGLELAVESLIAGRRESGLILLFTDGDDPVSDREWLRGPEAAAKHNIPIAVFGLGKTDRDANVPARPLAHTRQQEAVLKEIAERSHGRYANANSVTADVVGLVRAMMLDRPHTDDPELALARAPSRLAPFLWAGLLFLIVGLTGLRWRAATAGVAIAAMAAGPIDDWLRRGDAALNANQPERALQWYAKAEGRTPDPGLLAFNQGVALAALGRYRDAEVHFRWCLSDAEGERQAKALYNLGTCLVRRSSGKDREALQAAVSTLEEAAKVLPPADSFQQRINENLAVAKSLFAQAPTEQPNAPTDEPGPNSNNKSATADQPGNGSKPQTASPSGKPTPGSAAQTTDQQTPGAGTLPPLADSDEPAQLTTEDLETHLRQTRERISANRRERVKARESEKPPSYPDW